MKTAIVTGASSGIGYDLAIALSKKGYKVYGCAPELAVHLMEPLKEYGVVPFALDITKVSHIKKAVEFYKKDSGKDSLDLLYNNAGIATGGLGFEFDDDEMMLLMNVNLIGHIYMTKYFADLLIKAHGVIVFTASVAAISPLSWTSLYNATKAGIDAYAKSIRPEFAAFGVTVYSVITGGVKTTIGASSASQMAAKLEASPYTVPGSEESILSATQMTNNGMLPHVYAKKVILKVTGGFRGFNIYTGYMANAVRLMNAYTPLWFQYFVMRTRFKQGLPFREIKKKYGEK